MNERELFKKELSELPKEKVVFIDESGIEDNVRSLGGWSEIGIECFGERPYRHTRRISMIAGLCKNKIIASAMFEGCCDSSVFKAYMEQILLKHLNPGQTIVMDNISFHKTIHVQNMIKSAGCNVLYLPTYSPDLNPIEHFWFKIKQLIRSIAHSFDNFSDAVLHVLKYVDTFAP